MKLNLKSALFVLLATFTLSAFAVYDFPAGLNDEQKDKWTTILDAKSSLTGNQTLSGVIAFTGANTHSGLETGMRRDYLATTNATITVTTAMSSRVFKATASSGTQTFTLPAASTAGLVYTFICGNAGGEILINPTGTNTFSIQDAANGASIVTASSTGIKNTAATNVVGDCITLISDGSSQWQMISESGTWASQ